MSEDRGGFSEVIEAPAPIGHNIPPVPTPEEARAEAQRKHKALFDKAAALVDAEARIPRDAEGELICADDEWETRLGDTVRQIQAAHKHLDTARTSEKMPWDAIADGIHNLFRETMDKLVDPQPRGTRALKHRIERAITAYKVEKERIARRKAQEAAEEARRIEDENRRKAEQAAREAAEREAEAARKRKPENKAAAEAAAQASAQAAAEAAARATDASETRAKAEATATAPAADLTRTRGSYSVSSLQEFLDVRDLDRARLPAITLWPYLPDDAIEKAVRGYLKANGHAIREDIKNKRQPLSGATFFINHRSNVR